MAFRRRLWRRVRPATLLGAAILLLLEAAPAESGTEHHCYRHGGTWSSSCSGELIDAEQFTADGKPIRRYELKGTCSASGQLTCYYDDLEMQIEHEWMRDPFEKPRSVQFLFMKVVAWWEPTPMTARVQGYLIGEEDVSELTGNAWWEFSSGGKPVGVQKQSFIDLTYQCAIDPFVNPGSACKALTILSPWASLEQGLKPLVPPFGGSVSKAVADALVKKHADEKAAHAKKMPTATGGLQSTSASKQTTPPGGPILVGPSLAIVGAKPTVDTACTSIDHVLTVAISIRNTGAPLAAGLGLVSAKEAGGAGLGSAWISLPAFRSNQTRVVSATVGTTALKTAALPGPHQLDVMLRPTVVSGKPAFPATAYPLLVRFPGGLCQKARLPGRTTVKPAPIAPPPTR